MIVLPSQHTIFLCSSLINLVKKLTVYKRCLHFFTFLQICIVRLLFYLFLSLLWNCFCKGLWWYIFRCQVQKPLSVTILLFLSASLYTLTSLKGIFFWHFWQQILLIFCVLRLSFLFRCHFWLHHIPLKLERLHSQSIVFFTYTFLRRCLQASWLSILLMYP